MIGGTLMKPDHRRRLLRGIGLLIGLVTFVALGAAIFIATRDYAAIERAAIAKVEASLGGKLTYRSAKRVLWPKPKLVLEGIALADQSRRFSFAAPLATIRFDLIDLLDGSVDNPAITIETPDIAVAANDIRSVVATPRAMVGLIDQAIGTLDRYSGFASLRLRLNGAKLALAGAGTGGETIDITPLDVTLRHATTGGRIEFAATRRSATRPFEISFSLPTLGVLGGDRAPSASIHLAGFGSRASFSGVARRDSELALAGRFEATIGSPIEELFLERGAKQREAGLEALHLAATAMLSPRGASLEGLRIARGPRQLNGIAALREANGRWSASATLAGDLVDGTAVHANLQRLRGSDGTWSDAPLAINPLPAIDLDLRLSTKEFRLGHLTLSNVAISVLTRPGRAELAVIDSRFGEGGVKARVSVVDHAGGQDMRLQASADRIQIGRFLEKSVGFNRLSGTGSLVIQAESRGASVAALVSGLHGSGAIDVSDGEIIGIDLARLLNRATEGRPEAALLFALAGKTSFDNLRINFSIQDGKIEPIGSHFTSARVAASLEGMIDLATRRHNGAIVLRRRQDEAGRASEFYAFRVEGPLFAPAVKPDLSLLANRS